MKCPVLCLAVVLVVETLHPALAATVNVFTDRPSWESAVGGVFTEETFDDPVLVPGLSVVSTVGQVAGGRWDDQLTGGSQETEWFFSQAAFAFGGNWDTAGPGGSGGNGVSMTLSLSGGGNFSVGDVVPGNSPGDFYGIVSDTPFSSILLHEGGGTSLVETYAMDNLVFSNVPEPSTCALGILGLLSILAHGHRRRRVQQPTGEPMKRADATQ